MRIAHSLAVSAVLGILAGCGGEPPPAAATPSTGATAAGAKASCGGADHTDNGHCGAATPAPTPSASSSAAPPAAK